MALLNPTVIEASGSTSLVLAGSNYYLDSISTGTGPTLKYSGSAVTVDQWPSWSPVGAEQVSSGYDVVWKNSSTGMFSFWSTPDVVFDVWLLSCFPGCLELKAQFIDPPNFGGGCRFAAGQEAFAHGLISFDWHSRHRPNSSSRCVSIR